MTTFDLRVIGYVHSPLLARASAPKQGFEGSPPTRLAIDHEFAAAMSDLDIGDEIIVLTWLDRAERGVLKVHPRDDSNIPLTGVFSTRSPDRPNPIGLHRVKITDKIDNLVIEVQDLEAIHMTPIVDIKPVLKRNDDA